MTWYGRVSRSGQWVVLLLVAVLTVSALWQGFTLPTLVVAGVLVIVLLVWAVAQRRARREPTPTR